MRLFATDLDFTEWSGAWFSPSLGFDTGRDTVSGTFPQLCTRVKLAAGSEERNSIALYYVENLSLPRPEPIKISAGDTVQKSPKRFDLHSIDRNGLRMVFSDNLEFGGTQVIAKTHPDLSPPIAEMALAESVEYILCRPCRPRVTVRYFEDGALVFIRECRVKPRTGLPSPLRGSPAEILSIWDVFYTFLGQYFNRTEFAPPETSRILQEVIRASTGTVHTFAASLVLGHLGNLGNKNFSPGPLTPDFPSRLLDGEERQQRVGIFDRCGFIRHSRKPLDPGRGNSRARAAHCHPALTRPTWF
jgi:hypothetical protein